MQLTLDNAAVQRLLDYLALLQKWNRIYNLTALRDPQVVLTHHLYDCMAVVAPLRKQLAGASSLSNQPSEIQILDVGSGAGLPGLVLGICEPRLQISCIDAVHKKVAFLRQVIAQLGLSNLKAIHGRVEQLHDHASARQYQVVTARAFSSLTMLVDSTIHLLAPGGCWMAMKARIPADEIAELPKTVEVFHVEQLLVPLLDEDRCLVWMRLRHQEPGAS